ncbi:hypothetical protein Pmar_PMAR013690 [Perkinsus marinus ATCC 50983]|uniref:FYVE zinc finger domain-containing protein n=1 Tax=Perkinsus marinus (strain ATCC 50983 / TXsc) TaxID=423536 RepID=C5LY11_PERM5|nr:hypothetical protein Pmar_PMAR013690 [Perkinsus marinus ATCC 50983]EEQ98341.1 hypothetical protein Pmar_PMAR013690 [Perkinsus marinus ATCC 50983]|eukprot:XP_002765624.1 hypothetical protein Pmar_PMAR013690 [Perkinsus marinus ATCC 50983]
MLKRLTGAKGPPSTEAVPSSTGSPMAHLRLPISSVSDSTSAFGPPQEGRAQGVTSSIPIIDLDHDEDMVEEETATGVVDPQRRGWVASLVNIISLRRSRTDATALGGDQQARRDPPRPPSCWKCTVDFSFTNRARVCPMCGHQFCKACLAEAAAEMPLIPADLQDSVMRANRLSADPDWTTLEDVQQLEHENRDDPEVLDHPVDEDDDLGLDTRDSATREEVRKGLNKLNGTLCHTCLSEAARDLLLDRVKARQERIQLYLAGRLTAFKSTPESNVAMVYRLGGNFLQALRAASSVLPMGAFAKYISGAYYLFRYGPLCIYGSDILEAIGMLSKLTSSAGIRSRWTANTADVAAAM